MNIWFDMDGTLADTLKDWWALTDEQWIERVRTAKGIVNLSVVARLIHKAQANGHKVGIISWLPKSGNQEVVEAIKTQETIIIKTAQSIGNGWTDAIDKLKRIDNEQGNAIVKDRKKKIEEEK